jgi:endonuclease YncB( thermonuclease family)
MRPVLGREVSLQITGKNRFERILGVVYVEGLNVNLKRVRQGHAWQVLKLACDESAPTLNRCLRSANAGRCN